MQEEICLASLELPSKEPASPGSLGSKCSSGRDQKAGGSNHHQKSANGAGFPAPTPGLSVQGLTAAARGAGWGGVSVGGGVLVPAEPAAFSSPVEERAELLTANQRCPLQALVPDFRKSALWRRPETLGPALLLRPSEARSHTKLLTRVGAGLSQSLSYL